MVPGFFTLSDNRFEDDIEVFHTPLIKPSCSLKNQKEKGLYEDECRLPQRQVSIAVVTRIKIIESIVKQISTNGFCREKSGRF